jgi:NAD+ diphosphatase
MTRTFQRAYPPMQAPIASALWFPFQKDKLLVQTQGENVALLQGDELLFTQLPHEEILFIGTLAEQPCLALTISPEAELPEGWRALGLRELYNLVEGVEYTVASYAFQLIKWHQTSHYCPVCTSPMVSIPGGWGRQCTNNDYSAYPPVVPAMIVLVHDGGERILLVHKPGYGKRYGLMAGFVEPGESLEECVRREVKEEAGIEITDLKYQSSQSWPFPSQLMAGFTARYHSGTPHPQEDELDDVAWFTRDTLPEFPPPSSIAYQLITTWLKQQENQQTSI